MRALGLVSLLLAACAEEFTPRSVVEDTRVLAIVATPLEVGQTDSVTLTAFRVRPEAESPVSESWSFCPFSVGSTAGYACAFPECEFPLDPTPSGITAYGASNPVTAVPGALVLQCLTLLSASGSISSGAPMQLPEKFDVLFRYTVTGMDGERPRVAVQRIPLYLAGPPAAPYANVAPGIGSIAIGGSTDVVWENDKGTTLVPVLRSGEALDVRVLLKEGSAQPYHEGTDPRELREQLVVSFYTTAGRFDYDWATGLDASVKLKGEDLAAGTVDATVWVVARDLRGGETVAGPIALSVVAQAGSSPP